MSRFVRRFVSSEGSVMDVEGEVVRLCVDESVAS